MKAQFDPKDEAFYFAEEAVKDIVEPIGAKILHLEGSHIKQKTLHKRDNLFKTIKFLEHKTHSSHSTVRKIMRFEKTYKNTSFIDTPIQKLRKRLNQKH